MTRKEQIEKAATEYINSDAVNPMNMQMAFGDFINGAMWADGHPNQSFLLEALRDLKEVKTAIEEAEDLVVHMYNDSHISRNLSYARYKLDDAIENVELLIDEEE